MIRIGIGGNIGSGKTTVAKIFNDLGAKYINADVIGHKILDNKTVAEQLIRVFGPKILSPKGKIDRKKLAEVAFQNKAHQKKLNSITHPLIIREIIKRTQGKGVAVIEAPLLFECDLIRIVDYSILVTASDKLRLKRVKNKYPDIEKRLALQMPEKEARKRADFIIANRGSLSQLKKKCQKLWKSLTFHRSSTPPTNQG